jgi:hypothetical protein
MIKHWRLFDTISMEQINQLRTAKIFVRIEDDVSYLDFPIYGRLPIVRGQDIYISTVDEKQETILYTMFPDSLKFMGYNDVEIE